MSTAAIIILSLALGFTARRYFDKITARFAMRNDDVLKQAMGSMTYEQVLRMERRTAEELERRRPPATLPDTLDECDASADCPAYTHRPTCRSLL